jgi:hypothetical protein
LKSCIILEGTWKEPNRFSLINTFWTPDIDMCLEQPVIMINVSAK